MGSSDISSDVELQLVLDKGVTFLAVLRITWVSTHDECIFHNNCLSVYAKMQLIFCKDNASREQNQQACLIVLPRCSLSYAKIMQVESKNNKLA